MASSSKKPKQKQKQKVKVLVGFARIKASFNNTIITLTDSNGNALGQCSAGACGFKGSKKSTPYAASIAAKTISEKVLSDYGLKSVTVKVSGPGPGRESAIRALNDHFKVLEIIDITPIPHNGCRPEKERRV